MQAGVAAKRLTFREIFMSSAWLFFFGMLLIDFVSLHRTIYDEAPAT